jgi:parvulin-like peptidyl-prolyl isomerase
MPQFGFITEDQVNEFYSDPANEAKFEQAYAAQFAEEKKNKRMPEDQEPSEEQKKSDRSMFGKILIYEKEAKEQLAAGQLPEDWKRKTELMIGLQQTQFLVSKYAQEVLTKKVEVTDDDVKKYIADHPELQTTEKQQKAEEILARVKAGEDFAKIAKEVSDDPGSKETGGLYKGITKGQFVPEFEEAALAVQPGEIVDHLVKSKFGYHIIKLESRGQAKDKSGKDAETYDARHILISTGVKDPENPMSPEMPAEDFVKAKLQKDKRKAVLDQIVADNPVEVPDDFTVPQPSDEDMKKMMEQQMGPEQDELPAAGKGKGLAKPAAPKKK